MPKPFVSGNVRGAGRPVVVTVGRAAVRSIVRSWAGRTLRLQHVNELLTAEQTLTRYEADLASLSPNAPRLLAALRQELTSRGAPAGS